MVVSGYIPHFQTEPLEFDMALKYWHTFLCSYSRQLKLSGEYETCKGVEVIWCLSDREKTLLTWDPCFVFHFSTKKQQMRWDQAHPKEFFQRKWQLGDRAFASGLMPHKAGQCHFSTTMTADGFCTNHKNGDDLGILYVIGFTYQLPCCQSWSGISEHVWKSELRIIAVSHNSWGTTVSKVEPAPEIQKPKPKVHHAMFFFFSRYLGFNHSRCDSVCCVRITLR